MMSAKWMALLALFALPALSSPAWAATAEPRVNLLVRERPSSSARIVDRVPAGQKLKLLGRTADGQWAHVDAPKHDGWVPSEQLKGMVKGRKIATAVDGADDEAPADDDENAKPLAKRRNVRPEAWVSKSRYHDGEDTKLTISVNKASIYGRPSASSSEVGILRRGEVVNLVRKSPDKKWILVDIGGGESAWIEAKSVKPGAAKGGRMVDDSEVADDVAPQPKSKRMAKVEEVPVEDDTPPPPKKAKKVVAEEEVPVEEPPPEPAPTPKKKTKKQLAEERRAQEEADRRRDDEAAPGMASSDTGKSSTSDDDQPKPRKRKRGKMVASRDDSAVASDAAVERSMGSHGANYFGLGARGGIAILQQRFTSNGTGALTNYEAQTAALGVVIGAGYARELHRHFNLGVDASYAFAGAAGVRYHLNDPATPDPVLAVQSHLIDGGLRGALKFNVVGGLQLALRVGIHAEMNLIEPNSKVPLPSDIVLGMSVGLALDLPALFRIADRPFGMHIYGGGIVPANRTQTAGLEEGKASETMGAALGGSLTYNLYKGLGLEAAYSYSFTATHFDGQARRNLTITTADRGSAQHLITLGLFYAL